MTESERRFLGSGAEKSAMWQAVVDFVKGLFGGKGTLQIGKGNQAVTGTTSGHNSPIMAAQRDIHVNMPFTPPAGGDYELFSDLEKDMPDLLREMREDLAEHPLIRDVIVLDKSTFAYNFPDAHLKFAEDTHPGIRQKVNILHDLGLLRQEKEGFYYRITEKFAKYLKKAQI
jgi:hypothetical protein